MAAVVWFRNDLRIFDNLALAAAISSNQKVLPIFIYDKSLTRPLGSASKWWMHNSLLELKRSLKKIGADLIFKSGNAFEILQEITEKITISHIFWNRRYDQLGIDQDILVKSYFKKRGVVCESFNGYLLFEPHTIQNQQGKHFKIFTPFWKNCLSETPPEKPIAAPTFIKFDANFSDLSDSLDSLGLLPNHSRVNSLSAAWKPGENGGQELLQTFLENNLKGYKENRNYPSVAKTSKLSPYIRWGEISVRQLWHAIKKIIAVRGIELDSLTFLAELGWREFAYHTLFYNSNMATLPLNKAFIDFPYSKNQQYFQAWSRGVTGYPIVDAGMRELWQTGYMHNRVRMIVASFFTKHLQQPWQDGERWFWDTLVDADYASNSFNWQWVAGCGADAAPYFRIFNPSLQGAKFDPEGCYVRNWVTELKSIPNKFIHTPWLYSIPSSQYPKPLIEHKTGREQALQTFKIAFS